MALKGCFVQCVKSSGQPMRAQGSHRLLTPGSQIPGCHPPGLGLAIHRMKAELRVCGSVVEEALNPQPSTATQTSASPCQPITKTTVFQLVTWEVSGRGCLGVVGAQHHLSRPQKQLLASPAMSPLQTGPRKPCLCSYDLHLVMKQSPIQVCVSSQGFCGARQSQDTLPRVRHQVAASR